MTEAARRLVVNSDGLLVDPVTGVVVDESPIDYGPEWRSFSEEDRARRSRVGAPLTERMHDYGLTTFVRGRSESARKLTKTQISVSRLGKWSLLRALRRLNKWCRELGVGSAVCEDAAWATRILVKRLSNTRRDTIVRAALVWALALHGDELYYDLASRDLLKVLKRAGLPVRLNTDRMIYRNITEYCRRLGLPPLAEFYASKIYRVYLSDYAAAPRTIAASAVYLAAKLLDINAPMKKVARVANATDAAIRTMLKRSRIRILYLVDSTVIDEWYPGKNSYGAIRPSEIATMYGITKYSFTVDIPTSSNEPIKVVIREQ